VTSLARIFELEAALRGDGFSFDAIVGLARGEILVFFGIAAGPFDHDAFDLVTFAETESYREFGLREVAGSAFYQAFLA
jgi:hypothetical protein